jgi:hypothetical protein
MEILRAAASALQQQGFVTRQKQFVRNLGTTIQFIVGQRSLDHIPGKVKFTVNLSVFFPELDARYGRTSPPKHYSEGQWVARLNEFDSGLPEWWIVDSCDLDETVRNQVLPAMLTAAKYMETVSGIDEIDKVRGTPEFRGRILNELRHFLENLDH